MREALKKELTEKLFYRSTSLDMAKLLVSQMFLIENVRLIHEEIRLFLEEYILSFGRSTVSQLMNQLHLLKYHLRCLPRLLLSEVVSRLLKLPSLEEGNLQRHEGLEGQEKKRTWLLLDKLLN